MLGTPSVANATGSEFIYDEILGTSESWNCSSGFWGFFGFLALPGCGERLCYGVLIPFSFFV